MYLVQRDFLQILSFPGYFSRAQFDPVKIDAAGDAPDQNFGCIYHCELVFNLSSKRLNFNIVHHDLRHGFRVHSSHKNNFLLLLITRRHIFLSYSRRGIHRGLGPAHSLDFKGRSRSDLLIICSPNPIICQYLDSLFSRVKKMAGVQSPLSDMTSRASPGSLKALAASSARRADAKSEKSM